uniref:DDE_Tnp_1_7 domain-containing protein n=1 Tax=Haemonchus contortus TaxID=6289 RepID=A0A7I4Z0Z9_HAECO
MDLIVRETNRYGIRQNEEFQETSADEMRKFIGLCLQMGLVKMPNLRDYWSSRPCLGGQAGKIMRRTRFEELWKYLHLADNDTFDGDRLQEIRKFVEMFKKAAAECYSPERELCIDKSLVPFRGRIVFRQYLPAKRHRYGIKTFKLCSKGEYTVRIKIYAGRDPSREEPLADKVAVELVEGFLDERRVLCTDNYYSSIGLAEKLISRRTHLVGTLRTNRKGIPKAIKDEKLKRGQTCYKQRQNGILVLKWSEKRDLHMIFTKHDAAIGSSQKPTVVENYRHLLLTSPTR